MPLIEEDVPLEAFNTFGIDARACRLAHCRSVADLKEAAAVAARQAWPVLVLGGGSNIVFMRDFPGLVLKVETRGIELLDESPQAHVVRASAGENWHAFVMHALDRGWHGLENLSLIPGTVGAAPVQNIGAYGVELESLLVELTALDLASGALVRFDRAACRFAYRDSRFKRADRGRYAILDLTLSLPKGVAPNTQYAEVRRVLAESGIANPGAREVSQAIIGIRRAKLPDPAELGNVGSFFKNPVVDDDRLAAIRKQWPEVVAYPQPGGLHKLAAAWLIDKAGWKGKSRGAAAVYERQALVLVNRGGARAAHVIELARAIQADIRTRFGVDLETEPDWI